MSKLMKQWATSSSRGCCWSLVRSAHCCRPPKRMSPFSKNGLKHAILDPVYRGKFFWSKCSSAVNASSWTTFTQYIRATVSSVVVNSPTELSLRRAFRRKRKLQAVVRTNFQYELNLEASIRMIDVVAARTRLGFFFPPRSG